MAEFLYKFCELSRTDNGTFKLGFAYNFDREHMDGSLVIDTQHECYSFVKWAYENPLKSKPIVPHPVFYRINEKFKMQENPTWDNLLPDEYIEKTLGKFCRLYFLKIKNFCSNVKSES